MYYFVEPMVEEDIGQVQQIERESCSMPWSTNTYRRELRNPAVSRYLVARSSQTPPLAQQHPTEPPRRSSLWQALLGQLVSPIVAPNGAPIVGYGGVWLCVDEAHITTIAVALQHRGRGVGELLLNGLIDCALNMEAVHLTLEVRVSNAVAQNLYRKYGFQTTGRRRRYYTDNGEDAFIMTTSPLHEGSYQSHLKTLRQHLFDRLRLQSDTLDSDEGGQIAYTP